jgi:Bacterial SH3 domain
MAGVDITDVRPDENSFAERTLPPIELWAPPLAPDEMTAAAGQDLLRVDTIRPVIRGEDPFQPFEPGNRSETFGSRGPLIAGSAIVATLGLAGLTYFFLASPGAKGPAESAPVAVQSSTATPVQAAANVPAPWPPTSAESSSETPAQLARTVPEPSPGASVVPSADSPPSIAAGASPQVAPGAVTPQTAFGAQNGDPVFLQRPGVNIRSAPSGNAAVLGTVPRGTQFTVSSRNGDWVQVENARLKGWINSQFLGPNKPL